MGCHRSWGGLVVLLVSACAGPLPAPDPAMAWVDLKAGAPPESLMAMRLDRRPWPDGRYFQVLPGAHELELRYTYWVSGGAVSRLRDPMEFSCYLHLQYAGFAAGQRYRIEARAVSMRPLAWLQDSTGRKLTKAVVGYCGP